MYGNLSGGVSWLHQSTLSLREVASATGMSIATLSRLEHSEIPEMGTFLVLLAWTGWPARAFLRSQQVHDTEQIVAQALREDGILAHEVIEAFLLALRAAKGR